MNEEPVEDSERADEALPADLVPVASAANEFEAAMLVAVLEDHEIPAAVQGGAFGVLGGAGAQSFFVCVQAGKSEEAKAALAQARADAEERGVEQAFTEAGREDLAENIERNSVLREMDAMAFLDVEIRCERLRPYIVDWLTDGTPKVKIAEYLSGAGLSREQADQLIGQVVREDERLLEERRADKSLLGYGIAILGVVFIAMWAGYFYKRGEFNLALLQDKNSYALAGIGIFLIAVGLGYAYWVQSRKIIQRLSKEPEGIGSASKNEPSS
ncbi:MAG: ferric reductase-like transmembrane domain-containing protein [Planctomycetes bacterium]|nr:ferric reductase-like transmembrane domain-containing protein [Planctomycetota bacterium]